MAISNLVLTQQIYSEETNGAHAHYREPVPLNTTYLSSLQLAIAKGHTDLQLWLDRNGVFEDYTQIGPDCALQMRGNKEKGISKI